MNKKKSSQLSAIAMSALLFSDIVLSQAPTTFAESTGYTCIGVSLGQDQIANPCPNFPNHTSSEPIACFPEQMASQLDITYYASSLLGNAYFPLTFVDRINFSQNTSILSSPVVTFSQDNNFDNIANSPIPLSQTIISLSNGQHTTATPQTQNPFSGGKPYLLAIDSGYYGEDILEFTTQDALNNTHTGKLIVRRANITNQSNQTITSLAANIVANSSNTKINSQVRDDVYTINIVTPPSHGTVSTDNTDYNYNFLFTPASGYVGEDSFTYTISDGVDTSDPATVLINVFSESDRAVAPYQFINYIYDAPTYPVSISSTPSSTSYHRELFATGKEKNKLNFTTPSVASGSLAVPVNIQAYFQALETPYASATYQKTEYIRVDHIPTNSMPTLSNTTLETSSPGNMNVSFDVTDPENNQGTVVAQLSTDNFATFQTYPVYSGTLSGSHAATLANIPAGNYSARLLSTETNPLGVCADLGGGGFDPNKRTFSPIRSLSIGSGTGNDQTNPNDSIVGNDNQNVKLIRTGGSDI